MKEEGCSASGRLPSSFSNTYPAIERTGRSHSNALVPSIASNAARAIEHWLCYGSMTDRHRFSFPYLLAWINTSR
jgi:hypothetical protein